MTEELESNQPGEPVARNPQSGNLNEEGADQGKSTMGPGGETRSGDLGRPVGWR